MQRPEGPPQGHGGGGHGFERYQGWSLAEWRVSARQVLAQIRVTCREEEHSCDTASVTGRGVLSPEKCTRPHTRGLHFVSGDLGPPKHTPEPRVELLPCSVGLGAPLKFTLPTVSFPCCHRWKQTPLFPGGCFVRREINTFHVAPTLNKVEGSLCQPWAPWPMAGSRSLCLSSPGSRPIPWPSPPPLRTDPWSGPEVSFMPASLLLELCW